MTLHPRFTSRQSSLTHKTLFPHCSRCGVSIEHPVIEKEAGELIVRCGACNAANVLKLVIIDPTAILTLEVMGWKESFLTLYFLDTRTSDLYIRWL